MAEMQHANADLQEPNQAPPGAHGGHPSVKEYIRIALVLALLTGLEVAATYTSIGSATLIALLLGLAAIKFILVVLYFMHLKFDDRRYSRFFLMGLAGATTLFLIVLILFKVFLR